MLVSIYVYLFAGVTNRVCVLACMLFVCLCVVNPLCSWEEPLCFGILTVGAGRPPRGSWPLVRTAIGNCACPRPGSLTALLFNRNCLRYHDRLQALPTGARGLRCIYQNLRTRMQASN